MAQQHAPAPGDVIGPYRLERQIGAGGMGTVFRATHTVLGRAVALKVLGPEGLYDNKLVQRFVREGRAAALLDHPNVVRVVDLGAHEGMPYLVMELLNGAELGARLGQPLPVSEALGLLLPCLAAVAAAHDASIVHRDLKPANVFLDAAAGGEVQPKVLDFGLSKIFGDPNNPTHLTTTGAVLGTPYYMSPEQAAQPGDVDARTDQYSLAVMLYEALTGRTPFVTDNLYELFAQLQGGAYPKPGALRPDLPEGLEAVLLRAMAVKPADRFDHVRAFGAALLPFADARTCALWGAEFLGTAPASLPPPAPRPRSPLVAAGILAAALVVAVLLVAGALALKGARPPHRPPPPPPPPAVAVAPKPAPAITFEARVQTQPADAQLELDGQPVGRAPLQKLLPINGALHTLRVSAKGYKARVVSFVDESPPSPIVLDKAPKRRRKQPGKSAPARPAPGASATPAPTTPNRAPILR